MIAADPKQSVTYASTLNEPLIKPQTVRLSDVAFLGPALIYMGMKKKPLGQGEKAFLLTTGIATIIYNLASYFAEDQRQSALVEVEKERLKALAKKS